MSKIRSIEVIQQELNNIYAEINNCLVVLKKTDYCSNKSSDYNQNIEDLYPEQAKKREDARAKINELQSMIPALESELKLAIEKYQTELDQTI